MLSHALAGQVLPIFLVISHPPPAPSRHGRCAASRVRPLPLTRGARGGLGSAAAAVISDEVRARRPSHEGDHSIAGDKLTSRLVSTEAEPLCPKTTRRDIRFPRDGSCRSASSSWRGWPLLPRVDTSI